MTFSKRHKLTKKNNSNGGKKKSLDKKIGNNRKYCTSDCPIYDTCFLMPLSTKYGVCYRKKYPGLSKLDKLFNGEEKELFDITKDQIAKAITTIETEDDINSKLRLEVVKSLRTLHDMMYGTKQHIKAEHSGKVNIEYFKKYLEEND